MKNELVEQLNALKSCPFSPGVIWSEQQVMSIVKMHVPVFIIWSFREIQNGAFSEWFRVKLGRIWKTRNPESFKRNFNGFKNNLTWKIFLNGVGAVFAGRAGTITSFVLYEALWFEFINLLYFRAYVPNVTVTRNNAACRYANIL